MTTWTLITAWKSAASKIMAENFHTLKNSNTVSPHTYRLPFTNPVVLDTRPEDCIANVQNWECVIQLGQTF